MPKKKHAEEAITLINQIELIVKRAQRARAQESAMRDQLAQSAANPLAHPSVNEQIQASQDSVPVTAEQRPEVAQTPKPNHTIPNSNFSPGEEF